jgi:hypothetical protein
MRNASKPVRKFPVIDLKGPSTVELTLEQRYSLVVNIFKRQYFAVYRLIGERFGVEAANQIAIDVAEEAIPFVAEHYRRTFKLDGQGAALMSQILQAEFQSEGSDVAVLEETDSRSKVDINCLFGDALQSGRFKDSNIADGLCQRGCAVWVDKVAKTIDPRLEAERMTWMGDGAPTCRYVIAMNKKEKGHPISLEGS